MDKKTDANTIKIIEKVNKDPAVKELKELAKQKDEKIKAGMKSLFDDARAALGEKKDV